MDQTTPLSVSDVNELVKQILLDELGQTIYIAGEISECSLQGCNLYFSLKDAKSSIKACYWKASDTGFKSGDVVTVGGKISCWTARGTYQINVTSITKHSNVVGDLQASYSKSKLDFEQKQYFTKYRTLPPYIHNIAILTSTKGDAIKDIEYILTTHNFRGNVYERNCLVQGPGCPKSVREGIEYFNEMNKTMKIDILLISRGGGSPSDLMAYSDEEIVKAVHASDIFIISGVGHENDHMLIDYAADIRAPTPTEAATVIVKLQAERNAQKTHEEILQSYKHALTTTLTNYESKINNLKKIHKSFNYNIFFTNEKNRLSAIQKEIFDTITSNINDALYRIDKLKQRASVYSTDKILKKGYSILVDESGNLIDSVKEYKKCIGKGKKIRVMFKDGDIILPA